MYSLISSLNRLTIGNVVNTRLISTSNPVFFKITPCLSAEPMRRKKKMDPNILKAREDRKRRKIEKQIRRLEKHARQLKPIEELEIPLEYINNKQVRIRPKVVLSSEELENIAVLQKQWSHYAQKEFLADVRTIDRIAAAQSKAMKALKETSEELYQAALELDPQIVPVTFKGPVNTPPIKNYPAPDGEYKDISKKWEN